MPTTISQEQEETYSQHLNANAPIILLDLDSGKPLVCETERGDNITIPKHNGAAIDFFKTIQRLKEEQDST